MVVLCYWCQIYGGLGSKMLWVPEYSGFGSFYVIVELFRQLWLWFYYIVGAIVTVTVTGARIMVAALLLFCYYLTGVVSDLRCL